MYEKFSQLAWGKQGEFCFPLQSTPKDLQSLFTSTVSTPFLT